MFSEVFSHKEGDIFEEEQIEPLLSLVIGCLLHFDPDGRWQNFTSQLASEEKEQFLATLNEINELIGEAELSLEPLSSYSSPD